MLNKGKAKYSFGCIHLFKRKKITFGRRAKVNENHI